MLDAERVVEADLVAQLHFAPKLLAKLVRRLTQMREFHPGTALGEAGVA